MQGWNPPGAGDWDGTNPSNQPLFYDPVDPANAPTTDGDLDQQMGSPTFAIGATVNHDYIYLPLVVKN